MSDPKTNLAYLSLGSNIRPLENVKHALRLLAQQTRLLAVSTFWETEPVGCAGQPNYLNGAVIVETPLSAAALKEKVLRPIERQLGRVRGEDKNAPRTMDIDLIFFNRDTFRLGRRTIPSPEVLERAFVAIPLAEIAPDYIHPLTGQSLRTIARRFTAELQTMQKRADGAALLAEALSKT
ncbi:MAG: 2-amino-4-hydroxy-6-hydroxymethyldihydropteridine diphosphokinase [Caldilineae bacterium]|nr:MAG: 2-amino-4-hydroxy-6-hydroxymethyldihydropteridine diphosphokinase [Caldilineae bacterium]